MKIKNMSDNSKKKGRPRAETHRVALPVRVLPITKDKLQAEATKQKTSIGKVLDGLVNDEIS